MYVSILRKISFLKRSCITALVINLLILGGNSRSFGQASRCIDYGIGIGEDPYMFNDFFKFGGEWVPSKTGYIGGDTMADSYRFHTTDDFKLINGVYYILNNELGYFETNGNCNRLMYWDIIVDQGKILPSGYPTEIPLTIHPYKNKKIDPAQNPDLTKNITIGSVSRQISHPFGVPPTGWIIKWKGKGTFTFDGLSNVSPTLGTAVYVQDSYMGGTTQEFTSDAEGGGRATTNYIPHFASRYLTITKSDKNDPIRDIQFIYPGMESVQDGGQNINPDFISKVSQYKTIRYMDYMHSNGLEKRTYVPETHPYYKNYVSELKWDERGKPEWYRVESTHEYIIEISNLTKTNPWVNIPYAAGQDYVENMMKLYMEKLDPELTMYLELGNELWNWGGGGYDDRYCRWEPGFSGFHWMVNFQKTVPKYAGQGADNYAMGLRVNDVYAWITAATGPANMDRIVRTVGIQTGYVAYGEGILKGVDPINWDAVAGTWYYSLSTSDNFAPECRAPSGKRWRVELYDYWKNNPTDQAGFNALFKKGVLAEFRADGFKNYKGNADQAKAWSKKIVCYEGGDGVLGGNTNGPNGETSQNPADFQPNGNAVYQEYLTDNAYIKALAEADKSVENGQVITEILDSLKTLGYSLVNHYGFGASTSAWGSFNLFMQTDESKSLAELNSLYPKFKAFNDQVKKDNCADLFVNLPALSIGAGLSIKLDGHNDYIQADNVSYKPDDSGDYSLEAWVKPFLKNTKASIFSLTNSTQSGNTNLVYLRDDGKMVWEIKSGSGGMTIVSYLIPNANQWFHVAATKTGPRYTLYINGKNVASTNATIAASAKNKFSIGAFLSGTEIISNPLKGEIDEVRVWNVGRTEEQIRDFMCKKISPASLPAELKTYIRFDDGGNSLMNGNLAEPTKTASLKNIGFSDKSGYTLSGAPIGDISNYQYESAWTGVSLTLKHPEGDYVGINNLGSGSPDGVQIYWVNQGPHNNFYPRYYEKMADNKYFGVFMANGTEPTYDVSYTYQGNPQAGTGAEEDKHRLLKKENAAVIEWIHSGAQLDKVSHRLNLLCREKIRGEYNLGFRNNNKKVRPGSGMALQYKTPDAPGTATIISQPLPQFSDYTVSFWAKGSGYVVDIFSQEGISSWQGNSENIQLTDYVSLSFRYNGYNPDNLNGPNNANKDLWCHYVAVRKGTHVTLYVNGVMTAQKDFIGNNIYNTLQLISPPGWVGEVDITVDELTLWNTALPLSTIRDWMCKKITTAHPNSCQNLILYYNFDEGQGDVLEDRNGSGDLIMTPGYYTYVPSGAAIGDESGHDYDTPDNFTFASPQGDYMEANKTSGSPTFIQIYRVDNMSPVTNKVNDPAITSMDSSRYWGMYVLHYADNPAYDLTYHYGGNKSIKDESKLRELYRFNNADTTWTNPSNQVVNTTAKTITLPTQWRGEYVLGGDNGTFEFKVPAKPVFITESGSINTSIICGNSKSLIYKLKKDPLAVSYNWTVPAELNGFSNSDSIVLSGSYTGTAVKTVTLSVEAINVVGKSAKTDYVITINPQPTKADAGPDLFILPPSNSAFMDGNDPGTVETGVWSIAKGGGTIAGNNAPKTNITTLQSGKNIFVWTIKQNTGTCPASSDSVTVMMSPPPANVTLDNGQPLPKFICGGSSISIKVIPAEGVIPNGYTWVVPANFTILSQSGDKAVIQAAATGSGGLIKVKALYGTQNSPSDPYESEFVSIRSQPNKPVIVNPPLTGFCYDTPTTLVSQEDVSVDSVRWSLPKGITPTSYPVLSNQNIEVRPTQANGYIKIQGFNDGCTNVNAADSFLVIIKTAPKKPQIHMMGDGNWAKRYCNGDILYSVENPDANTEYNWYLGGNTKAKIIEYFGTNRHSALISMKPYTEFTYITVQAEVQGLGCTTSDPFTVNPWWKDVPSYSADAITISDPNGQNPSTLVEGETYTLTTSCSTCPPVGSSTATSEGQVIWDNNYFWDLPAGASLVPDGNFYDNTVKMKVDKPLAGKVRAWAMTMIGCVGTNAEYSVQTPDGILAPEYVSGEKIICTGSKLTITVKDVQADKYYWQFPNGKIDSTDSFVFDKIMNTGMQGNLLVSARKGKILSEQAKIDIFVKSSVLTPLTFFDASKSATSKLLFCKGVDMSLVYTNDNFSREFVWYIDEPRNVLQFYPFIAPFDLNENGVIDANEQNLINPRSTGRDTVNVFQLPGNKMYNGTYDGYLYVKSRNGCAGGADRKDSIPYTYTESPSLLIPVFTEAPSTLCTGSRVTYSVKPLPNVYEYVWSLPPGLKPAFGSKTTSVPQITVDVESGDGGKISVYGLSKACGGGGTQMQYTEKIVIQGKPIDFNFIDPPMAGCLGDTLTFKVNDIGASKYTWSLPGGLSTTIIDDSDPTVKTINAGTGDENNWIDEGYPTAQKSNNKVSFNRLAHGDTLIYSLNIAQTGKYKVYFSYVAPPSWFWRGYSSSVPVEIYHQNGVSIKYVNETSVASDGIFQFLDTFNFNQGTTAIIKVYTSANYTYTSADAFKLELLGIDGGTTMRFPVTTKGSGSVCVTIPQAGCPAGYQKCTEVNLGGDLIDPSFTEETDSICPGKTYTYTLSDASADSYTWILPNGWKIGTQTGTVTDQPRSVSITAGSAAKGAFNIEAFAVSKCGAGQSSKHTFTKNIYYKNNCDQQLSKPIFSAESLEICEGNAATYTVNAVLNAERYAWILPLDLSQTGNQHADTVYTVTNSISIEGKGAGNKGYIKVKALSSKVPESELASTTAEIIVKNPKSLINVTGSLSFCTGDSVKLISSSTLNNQWYKDGAPLPGMMDSVLIAKSSGLYHVIYTDGSCISDTTATGKIVSVNTKPLSQITPEGSTTICEGDTVTLHSASTLGNQWYKDGQIISDGTNADYAATISGTYNVIFKLGASCISDSTNSAKTIVVNPKPKAKITSQGNTFCEGIGMTINSDLADSYQWYKDGEIITSGTLQKYEVTETGYYNLIVSLASCSSDSTGMGINLSSLSADKTIEISTNDVCPDTDGAVTIQAAENEVDYETLVNNVSIGTIKSNGSALQISVPKASLNQSSNIITVKASKGICPAVVLTDTDTITIRNINTELAVNTDSPCYKQDGTVTISSSQNKVTYEVFVNNASAGTAVGTGNDLPITINANKLSANGEIITVQASGFSCSPQMLSNTATIKMKDQIQKPGKIVGESEICKNDEEIYSVVAVTGAQYIWTHPSQAEVISVSDTGLTESMLKLSFTDSITGKSYVSVQGSFDGCLSDTSRIEIRTKPNCGEIYIPNIITPNSNDNNNEWVIQGIQNYQNADIKIMNRWGSLVFESKGYAKTWKGNSKNNEQLPTGTYYYIIDLNNKTNGKSKNKTHTGSVTIMR